MIHNRLKKKRELYFVFFIYQIYKKFKVTFNELCHIQSSVGFMKLFNHSIIGKIIKISRISKDVGWWVCIFSANHYGSEQLCNQIIRACN